VTRTLCAEGAERQPPNMTAVLAKNPQIFRRRCWST